MADPRSVKDLQGEVILAQDGAIGFVTDLYFNDHDWRVRYLVVDTGRSMPQREVLIPAASIVPGSQGSGGIRVSLTKEQVEKSPEADTARPVARQHELTYAVRARSDPRLRSSEFISGFGVQARDGAIGHVKDFLVDEQRWTITGMVVATRNWIPGKRVVVSPESVERIYWPDRKVHVRLTRRAIRELPDSAKEAERR